MDGSGNGTGDRRPLGSAWLGRRRNQRILAAAAALVILAGCLAGGSHALGLDRLPDVRSVARPLPSDTLLYDRTGSVLLADLHPGGYQHYQVPLSALGRWLPAATSAEAGSALGPRLVRLRLGVGDSSKAGRIRQAVLAGELSLAYSASQILEMYVNSVFYGNGAYGGQAAARVYFDIDASKLDLAQAALLAGLPEQPTQLDPLRNWSGAKRRQRQVLDAMVRDGTISRPQADRAYAETLRPSQATTVDLAPAFDAYVAQTLSARYGKDALPRGGLKVVTTLDWALQQQADQAVRDAVQASAWRGATNGALVATDPRTGGVLAMVGSVNLDAPLGQLDMALWPPRNPGTGFTVFTYAAAIASRRYTMVTPIADAPLVIDMAGGAPLYAVQNADHRFHGTCNLQECLGNGLAVPAVEVELGTGLPRVVETARALGAPPQLPHFQPTGTVKYTGNDPVDAFGPSLTLGGYGETPLQMATAASALAAGGTLRGPVAVQRVSSAGGVSWRPGPASGRQAVDPGTAFIVSQMLADDVNRAMILGRGSPLTLAGRHAAALKGTTDDFSDAWTVGYTPSLAAAVWIGDPGFRPMTPGSDAVFVAAPAWHQFMQAALDQLHRGDEWYTPPPGLDTAQVDGRPAYFLPGTSASTPAPALPASAHLGG